MYRILIVMIASLLLFGCGEKKDHEDNYNSNNEGAVQDGSDTSSAADTAKNQNIIREGVIDLASIDQNKDSKLFECTMDWNVVSDHEGNCPLCKMELEELSVTKVRDNLQKNDYQVK